MYSTYSDFFILLKTHNDNIRYVALKTSSIRKKATVGLKVKRFKKLSFIDDAKNALFINMSLLYKIDLPYLKELRVYSVDIKLSGVLP